MTTNDHPVDVSALVIRDMKRRVELGMERYGRPLEVDPSMAPVETLEELTKWLRHLYEEQMDSVFYTKAALVKLGVL